MDLDAAQRLALALMTQHGLLAAGWSFAWSHGRRQLGSAHIRRVRRRGRVYETRTLRLSRHLVWLNDETEVRDTILHEIAHALVGIEHGHDAAWRACCKRIGAVPRRLAGEHVRVVPPRYSVVCGCCRRTVAQRYRRMARDRLKHSYCRTCGPASLGRLALQDALMM